MAITGWQTGSDLYGVIMGWEQLGIFDVVLPFLLVFTMTFAVLEKIKLFGEGKKNINVIISLVIGLLFLRNNYIVFLISRRFLPNIAMVMVIVLLFILLVGIFAGEYKGFSKTILWWGFIFSIGSIIYALVTDVTPYPGGGFGNWFASLWYGMDPMTRGTLLFLIIIVVVVSMFTRSQEDSDKKMEQRIKGIKGE